MLRGGVAVDAVAALVLCGSASICTYSSGTIDREKVSDRPCPFAILFAGKPEIENEEILARHQIK
jgi:hypothetical protein